MPGGARPAAGAPGGGPAPGNAGSSAPAVKCDWSEHTAPDGRKYYYNSVTKTSVWQKPKALADAEAEALAAKVIADCPWKEHKAPDGRFYYHNRAIGKSVWKVPEELAAARAEAARLRATISGAAAAPAAMTAAPAGAPGGGLAMGAAAAKAAAGGKPGAAAAAAAAPAAGGEFMYATKDEAKAAFKAMLTALQAPVEAKWDKIAARMEAARDPRFHALKSNGERASCYKDWVRDRMPPKPQETSPAHKQRPAVTHHACDAPLDQESANEPPVAPAILPGQLDRGHIFPRASRTVPSLSPRTPTTFHRPHLLCRPTLPRTRCRTPRYHPRTRLQHACSMHACITGIRLYALGSFHPHVTCHRRRGAPPPAHLSPARVAVQIADQKAASAKAAEEEAARRRDAFVTMLQSKAALLVGARYSKVEALFFQDPRFEALPEPQRQAVYSEWQAERRRAAEAEERANTELRVPPPPSPSC